MHHPYQGYLAALAKLNAVFGRVLNSSKPDHDTRDHEEPCPRCEENPCVCGNAEYEAWLTGEQLKAEAEGRD